MKRWTDHVYFVLVESTEPGNIGAAAQINRVAILFGNEHSGLTNGETDCCSFLLTMPSSTSFPSLNLAQSVMLVAYELSSPAGRRPAEKVSLFLLFL